MTETRIPNLLISSDYNNVVNTDSLMGSFLTPTLSACTIQGSTPLRIQPSTGILMNMRNTAGTDLWQWSVNVGSGSLSLNEIGGAYNPRLYFGPSTGNVGIGTTTVPEKLNAAGIVTVDRMSFPSLSNNPLIRSGTMNVSLTQPVNLDNVHFRFPDPFGGYETGPDSGITESSVLVNRSGTQTVLTPVIFDSAILAVNGVGIGSPYVDQALLNTYESIATNLTFTGPWSNRTATCYFTKVGDRVHFKVVGPVEATVTVSTYISISIPDTKFLPISCPETHIICPVRTGGAFSSVGVFVVYPSSSFRVYSTNFGLFPVGSLGGIYQTLEFSWLAT
jgi:hypothetical protein